MPRRKLGRQWEDFSLSSGTLSREDVFENITRWFLADPKIRAMVAEYALYNDTQNQAHQEIRDSLVWGDLFDYLNQLAPEGYFFGEHLTAKANFGFWRTLTLEEWASLPVIEDEEVDAWYDQRTGN